MPHTRFRPISRIHALTLPGIALSLAALNASALVAQSARTDSVAFASGNITLRGIVYLPAGPPPYSAVFFLHGGGDRFLNNEPTDFARFAVAQGIAALVFDKRGTGRSGGDYASQTFEDLLGDAREAYRYLVTRTDIRPTRIGVVGFSQGGRLAPIVAASLPLAVAISVSGPAVSVADQRLFALENTLRANRLSDAVVDSAMGLWRAQFDAIANGTPLVTLDPRIIAARRSIPAGVLPGLAADFVANPILNSFRFDHDADLQQLKVPFLALFGGDDAIVPVVPSVAILRQHLGPDRRDTMEIVVLPGATHALDRPPGTRHPEYVPRVMAWLSRYLKNN